MNPNDVSRIADLAGSQSAPLASVLVPDVRSGSTFSYKNEGSLDDDIPPFIVVWFYTVEPTQRAAFAAAVSAFEATPAALPNPPTGLKYRGTYSVSVSSAAPKFEYRTIWALSDLSKLKTLNDYIHAAAPTPAAGPAPAAAVAPLRAVLKLISLKPAMRTEIMGLTMMAVPKDSL
jgi:hypothetical protein